MYVRKFVAEVNQSPKGRVKGREAPKKMMKKLREVDACE
jgi:hypothetical protein